MPRRWNTFSSTRESITVLCTSQPARAESCSMAASALGSVTAQMERAMSTSSVCRRGFAVAHVLHLQVLDGLDDLRGDERDVAGDMAQVF